ncbi:MAG TPA: GTPase ObgE [Candidatus Krumholzibacteria bacterium]|nr:GTPase ObgE [Candidatus Krumholzibacteria bacterium]HRX50678.1 GTPase ObgE [Candidatus Krumholzibacteria bacterium]
MKFVDVAEIQAASGNGGDGCVAYRREKGVPRGGPNGGNGGAGGNVWLVASSSSSTLQDFRYRRSYQAEHGQPGGGWNRTGPDGADMEIPIPCGTIVYDAKDGRQLADLSEPGQRELLLRGGRGGRGNYEFRNSRNQTPDFATSGRPGEARALRLELKLLADIGLIGLPNAGKSTLLSRLTAARPKIADYPFTTLIPNLGIVDLGDMTSCTLADIPGLIEGASDGKGLGHEFLRHVERTRALVYLVDVADPAPVSTLQILRKELEAYGRRLGELPFAVVLNKLDIADAELLVDLREEVQHWAADHGARKVLMISAVTGQGLESLRHELRDLYRGLDLPAGS